MVLPVLAAGGLVRLAVWWQNRSLFIDEANLARNFCEKGLTAFLSPLDHDQYAPPLFCMAERLCMQYFGQQEQALRLFPLLCGLASLVLFYHIARRLITEPWVLLMAAWIFSFSDILIRYATEGKQYGCDLAVALGLVAWGLAQAERRFQPWLFGVAGVVAVWLSMPSVFVLFGAGLFFFRKSAVEKNTRAMLQVAGAAAVWLVSFMLNYWLILRPSLGVQALVEYHKTWFFPLFPGSWAQVKQARDLLLTFPYYTAGHTVLALATGSIGTLGGVIYLVGKQKPAAFLVVLPVLVCVLVSGFGQYSLAPRMLVWAFPLALLAQGRGWQWAWERIPAAWLILPFVLFAATAGLQQGWQYLRKPFTIEEIRPVLEAIGRDFQAGDAIYVGHEAWPAVAYYTECHREREHFPFSKQCIHGAWDGHPTPDRLLLDCQRPRRIWLVYSHVVSEASRHMMEADLAVIDAFAQRQQTLAQPGAYGYLYTWKPR